MLVSMSYVTKLPPQQMLAIQARGNLISTLGVTLPQPAACCVWICGIKSTSKHYVHLSELERTGRRYTCPNKALSPNTSASQTADNMYTSIFQDDCGGGHQLTSVKVGKYLINWSRERSVYEEIISTSWQLNKSHTGIIRCVYQIQRLLCPWNKVCNKPLHPQTNVQHMT